MLDPYQLGNYQLGRADKVPQFDAFYNANSLDLATNYHVSENWQCATHISPVRLELNWV